MCPGFPLLCLNLVVFLNFFVYWFERERKEERERNSSCCSTYWCIHSFILVCALTGDGTHNLRALGTRLQRTELTQPGSLLFLKAVFVCFRFIQTFPRLLIFLWNSQLYCISHFPQMDILAYFSPSLWAYTMDRFSWFPLPSPPFFLLWVTFPSFYVS